MLESCGRSSVQAWLHMMFRPKASPKLLMLQYLTNGPQLQASGNVAGLCNWAAAMCTYHAVEKDVEPKIKALRAAEAELRVAEKEKNAALAQLATVQASLDDMQVRGLLTGDSLQVQRETFTSVWNYTCAYISDKHAMKFTHHIIALRWGHENVPSLEL